MTIDRTKKLFYILPLLFSNVQLHAAQRWRLYIFIHQFHHREEGEKKYDVKLKNKEEIFGGL
jgi:hypothetical protein